MNESSFLGLVQNTALLLAMAVIFDISILHYLKNDPSRRPWQRWLRQAALGFLLSAFGIAVMLTPWNFAPGIIFDTRSILLAISGLFFGTIPTLVIMAVTAAFRVYLGGAAAAMGVSVILATGTIGILWGRARRQRLAEFSWREFYLFGLVIHMVMLACAFVLPLETALQVLASITLPVLVIYPLGTALLGMLLANRLRRDRVAAALSVSEAQLRLTAAELRKSEAQYRLLTENIKDVVWILDAETLTFKYVSPSVERLRGYTPQEILAQPLTHALTPEAAAYVNELIRGRAADLRTGRLPADNFFTEEVEQPSKDGSTVCTEVVTNLYLNPENDRVEIRGVTRDIRERKQAEATLRESEERYRKIFDSTNDALFIQAVPSGAILDVNQRMLDMYGYADKHEALKCTIEDLSALDEGYNEEKIREMNQKAIDSNSNSFEWRAKKKNGEKFWVQVSLQITQLGAEDRILTTVHDISASKQAEETLKQSEERFNLAISGTGAGLWDWDMVKDTVYFSPQWKNMLGYKDHEVENAFSGWKDLWHVDDAARIEKALSDHLEGRTKTYEIVHRLRHKDGSWHWIITRGDIHSDVAGKPLRWIGTNIDMTERMMIEEALRESEARNRMILDHSSDLIWNLSPQGVFTYASPSWKMVTGYAAEEIIGKPFQTLVHEEDIPACMTYLAGVLESRQPAQSPEYRVRHAGGDWRWHQAVGNPVLDKDGSAISVIGVSRDITTRKQAEEKILADQVELHRLLEEAKQSRRALLSVIEDQKRAEAEKEILHNQLLQAQKMESIGRLAGGMAHDFNNLLGVIMGHTETALAKTASTQAGYRDLQEILKASKRSADLIRQLLAFARKQIINPRVLDLNDTIANMIKMLKRMIGEDIQLVWRPDLDLKPVFIDPSQVDQVVVNLLVNARDAITGVGKIEIETGHVIVDHAEKIQNRGLAGGEYALLTISDNGSGMDQETLSHLFEPFFTTKEVGKGTGLGLATTFGIIKQNNGNIYVTSQPGKGTTFTIYLPVRDVEGAAVIPDETAAASQRGSEKILIVEDEEALLQLGIDALEDLGYDVLGASTPAEALRMMQEHAGSIHLLITDVIMPEMNGKDLVRQIRLVQPGLKCLFMSGYTADIIADHGVLDEGVFFIQKPFLLKDLADKVRQVLET